MNVMAKRIIEIAGSLVVGDLMSDAVNKVIEVFKKVVVNKKEK